MPPAGPTPHSNRPPRTCVVEFIAMNGEEGSLTLLLNEAGQGNAQAREAALALVYDELRRIARMCMGRERPDHTLQATELIGELYIRLLGKSHLTWNDRQHFYATAARAMRRILVDHAKRRNSEKQGGRWHRVDDVDVPIEPAISVDVLALDRALEKLEGLEPEQCRIVELRFFCGFTSEEVARLLGVSRRTITRDWETIRDWLYAELEQDGPNGSAAVATR